MTEERPQAVRTMALHEHEQRKLDEIEQHLAEESPLLVRHFTALRPVSTSVVVCGVLGALVLLFTGLVIMVVGVRLAAPGPIACGALITAVAPTAIGSKCSSTEADRSPRALSHVTWRSSSTQRS